MAIVKLVCQGCGANLDAPDSSRIIECGYCGAQNQIKTTVYQQAPAPPAPRQHPPVQLPPIQVIPQMQYQVVPQVRRAPKSAAPLLGGILVLGFLAPVVVGGVIAFMALRGVGMDERGQAGGRALAGEGGEARKYRWESGRPFVADLDGDGTEDLLGIVQILGTPTASLSLVAISGADWHMLWDADLGDRATMPEQPRLRFVAAPSGPGGTAIFAMGAAVRAFEGQTGQQKWIANVPDKTAMILLDGDSLWVRSIDESRSTIALANGVVAPSDADPSADAQPLRTDYGYDLIPSNRHLDLESEQFAELRIDTAFCPPELLEPRLEPIRGFGEVPCTWGHGLVWASRKKGTAVPFLLGYEPATKTERWRQQLGRDGSLETIDTGFNQPRAEFVDEDAVISFSPSSAKGAVTIRRISMADGATKWETTLNQKSTEHVDGMVVGRDRVYVDHGGCMVVLNLATGAEVERLGGW